MDELLFWHWWVLGFALLIAELLLPGTLCLWLGMAAFVTGITAWLLPALNWQAEVVIYAALSVVAVGLWFRYKPLGKDTRDNGLNQRGRSHVGQTYTLVEEIVNGVGRARVDDSVWSVRGPDLPIGSKVRVVAVDGASLLVEAA